jgi:hypothetical protein
MFYSANQTSSVVISIAKPIPRPDRLLSRDSSRMVVIRYDSLKFADKKIVLPGGTKDGLKMLPAFEYSKE